MNTGINFPIGIPASWRTPEAVGIPDAYLKNWLLDTGSLTERLQSHCRHFSLKLLGQQCMAIGQEERQSLMSKDAWEESKRWQVREVLLYGEGQPWVFARSILPDALCQRDLAGLGRRPLGQIIFNDCKFKRSPFALAYMPDSQAFLGDLAIAKEAHPLWGRRSLFTYQSFNMMVMEVFLPGAPAYKQIVDWADDV